jgi:hypothetical protein
LSSADLHQLLYNKKEQHCHSPLNSENSLPAQGSGSIPIPSSSIKDLFLRGVPDPGNPIFQVGK